MQVPAKRKRRRVASTQPRPCLPVGRNSVWSYDFVFDACANRQSLKCLTVVDEYTRQCLAIDVAGSIRAGRVIEVLSRLISLHGAPAYLRSDNGPEFIATAVQDWLASSGVKTLFIAPGSPWENAYLESFNGKLEDELLGGEIFNTLLEARVLIEEYRVHYNHERPHSSLDYRTPAEFAATCRSRNQIVSNLTPEPGPSFPHATAGSCTKVLSSQRMENSTTLTLS